MLCSPTPPYVDPPRPARFRLSVRHWPCGFRRVRSHRPRRRGGGREIRTDAHGPGVVPRRDLGLLTVTGLNGKLIHQAGNISSRLAPP